MAALKIAILYKQTTETSNNAVSCNIGKLPPIPERSKSKTLKNSEKLLSQLSGKFAAGLAN